MVHTPFDLCSHYSLCEIISIFQGLLNASSEADAEAEYLGIELLDIVFLRTELGSFQVSWN
jgi:hypothetical protein